MIRRSTSWTLAAAAALTLLPLMMGQGCPAMPGDQPAQVQDISPADAIAGLDQSKTYLVYCGSNHRSPGATSTIVGQDFANVYNMLGGLGQWKAEGRSVVQ